MIQYIEKCEEYFRIHSENRFDFQGFNLAIAQERVKEGIIEYAPQFHQKKRKENIRVWFLFVRLCRHDETRFGNMRFYFQIGSYINHHCFRYALYQPLARRCHHILTQPRPKTGKRGVPPKYAEQVNPNEPDMNCFTLCHHTNELKVYNTFVYC